MKAKTTLVTALLCAAWSSPATAAASKIGVVAPLSGPFAILGRQVADGANAAATSLSPDISIVTADDKCDADGGAAAAKSLLDQNVDIVVGFLCTEALEAALPVLRTKGIAVVTPGVRAPSLAEERASVRPPVFRLQPEPGLEAAAAARILARIWRDDLFAIVDDGTIYGRDLAETVRLALDEQGLKAVFTDTYRPGQDNQIALVGRLKRAGATHVFVGGQRDDVATIVRDAAKLGYSLVVAGGEALLAAPGAVDLQSGTLMVAPPPPETLESAAKADAAITATGELPEGYAVPAYAAVEIAAQALAARKPGRSVADILADTEFRTALGGVRFGDDGSRTGNPYRLYRYDGNQFVELNQ